MSGQGQVKGIKMTFLTCWALVTTISNGGRPKLVIMLPKALGRYCISMSFILSISQGQAKVTKGHQDKKNRVTHVLWPILFVDFNGGNIFGVWRLSQVTKGQIRSNFIFIFEHLFMMVFCLLIPMVSFIVACDDRKCPKNVIENRDVTHWYICWHHMGSKIEITT